jgi:hypothetical protein
MLLTRLYEAHGIPVLNAGGSGESGNDRRILMSGYNTRMYVELELGLTIG